MTDLERGVAALTTIVVGLSGLVPVVIRIWRVVSAQERRIDLFWRARLLRGTAEGLQKRLLSEQVGPDTDDPERGFMTVAVTPAVYRRYEPIAAALVRSRQKNADVSPTRLAELIEERFGPWIAGHICMPLGVSEYACVVMALSIANGIAPAEPPPTGDHKPL